MRRVKHPINFRLIIVAAFTICSCFVDLNPVHAVGSITSQAIFGLESAHRFWVGFKTGKKMECTVELISQPC